MIAWTTARQGVLKAEQAEGGSFFLLIVGLCCREWSEHQAIPKLKATSKFSPAGARITLHHDRVEKVAN